MLKKTLFLHNLLQDNVLYVERGLLHLNIVYRNSETLDKFVSENRNFFL